MLVPGCLVLATGLILPLAYLASFSLNPSRVGVTELTGNFTLAQYSKLFSDFFYLNILGRTITVALITTTICAFAGYVLAFSLWRASPKWRAIGTVIVLAPLLVSIVARTYGWMVILGDRGVVNKLMLSLGIIGEPLQMMYTQGAIIVGLVHVFLPFMVLSIMASLERIDPSLEEAALTLGASPLTVVRLVFLPLSLPGLAAGITIVFSLSMSAYVTPALMGGSGANMLTTLIYQQFIVVYNWHFGAALVVLLLMASLALVAVMIYTVGRRTRTWSARA
jgi:putative spermidine/putrescine transport system permease protein